MSLKIRFFYLLIGWLSSCIIYVATGAVTRNAWIIPESAVENYIPYSPYGIWLYISFYIYIPYTFFTAEASKIKLLSWVFIISGIISGILFLLVPTSMVFPDYKTDGISAFVLNFIAENDTPQNCFPSMHGSLITICTLANWNRKRKIRSYACVLLVILMYYSIIQVRRHLFIDLMAGAGLGVLVWVICSRIWKHESIFPKNNPQ